MQSETTTANMTAKQTSGLTVPQWCAENGIKTKSFYYRLQKVREQYIHSAQAVIPLTVAICSEVNAKSPSRISSFSGSKGNFYPCFCNYFQI